MLKGEETSWMLVVGSRMRLEARSRVEGRSPRVPAEESDAARMAYLRYL
jgi:hypothetical protein